MRTPVPARATAMDMERMYNGMYAQWQMGMGVRDKLGDTACSGERGARTEVPSKGYCKNQLASARAVVVVRQAL